jgi:hypothetical protein
VQTYRDEGISWEKIARAAGVNDSALARWLENGKVTRRAKAPSVGTQLTETEANALWEAYLNRTHRPNEFVKMLKDYHDREVTDVSIAQALTRDGTAVHRVSIKKWRDGGGWKNVSTLTNAQLAGYAKVFAERQDAKFLKLAKTYNKKNGIKFAVLADPIGCHPNTLSGWIKQGHVTITDNTAGRNRDEKLRATALTNAEKYERLARRQDSGFHEPISLSPMPRPLDGPEPLTLAELRAAAQPFHFGSDGKPALLRFRPLGAQGGAGGKLLAVPDGAVGLDLIGRGGVAYVGDRPVRVADLEVVLAEFGVADRPRVLYVCEALAGPDPVAVQMAKRNPGLPVLATASTVWVDARAGIALAADATLRADKTLKVIQRGTFVEIVANVAGEVDTVPLSSTIPTGAAVDTEGGDWSHRMHRRAVSTMERAGSATVRRVSRLFGAYRTQTVLSGQWLRPEGAPTAADLAFAAAVAAMPAVAGVHTIVVGTPGVELPPHVIDQVRELVSQARAAPTRTRLVFPGRLSAEQLAWVHQRVVKSGVEVLTTAGEVRPGPNGTLYSTHSWQLLTRTPAGGTATANADLVYPSPAWEQALGAIVLPPGARRIPAGLLLVPPVTAPAQVAAMVAAMAVLPPDPARLTIVADGWTDVARLTGELRELLTALPRPLRASLRLVVPNAGPTAGLAQEVAHRLQIPIVAPTGAWTPATDGRGYAVDGTGTTVWQEPGWTTYHPNPGPRFPLNTRLRAIYNLMRRVPGGVIFDGAVRDPTLTALDAARLVDYELFAATIVRTADGEDYRVGNQEITEHELADLIRAIPEAADLPVLLVTDAPVTEEDGEMLAHLLQQPLIAADGPVAPGTVVLNVRPSATITATGWVLYMPYTLRRPDYRSVFLGSRYPFDLGPVRTAMQRMRTPGRPVTIDAAPFRAVVLGNRILIERQDRRLSDDPHLADLLKITPGPNQVLVYARSEPDIERRRARYRFELRRTAWDIARMLDTDSVRQVWPGKEIIFITDSHFDGVDGVGQLMANYLVENVTVSTRAFMARDGAMVSSSVTIRRRADGRYYLAPADQPNGDLRRYAPRGPGRQPTAAQSLGPVLPRGRTVSAVPHELVSTLAPPNRTTPAIRPANDLPRPGTVFSASAQRLWNHSELVPNGRSFYGLLPHRQDRDLAYFARMITPLGGDYVIDLHGVAEGFGVAGEDFSVEVLAEVIAADPRWTGQPILLTACNVFDNRAGAAGFFPLAWRLADELQDRIDRDPARRWPQGRAPRVQVIGAGGLGLGLADGRVYAVSEYRYIDRDGNPGMAIRVGPGDRFYRFYGRRRGETGRPAPQPLGSTYASRGRPFVPNIPAGAVPWPVAREPLPEDSPWPPRRGYRPTAADRHVVHLILPAGEYADHRTALAWAIAQDPAYEAEIVALRAYLSRPDAYETDASAGGAWSRSLIDSVYASLDLLLRSTRPVYLALRSNGRDPRQVVADLIDSRELLAGRFSQPDAAEGDIVIEIPADLALAVDAVSPDADAIVPRRPRLVIAEVVPNSPGPGRTRVVLGQ